MIDYSVYLTGNPMDEMAPEKAYARAATLKAEKEGLSTVDLEAAKG